jgi:tetratricopeptide (TPR) repeat protein
MATSDDSPSPSEQVMREGMEGLIAAMKEPRPRSLESAVEPASESTVVTDEGSGDPLAAAPWDAVDVSAQGDDEPPGLERGATIGRLVVIDELGAGGMGVVYAAYDPELDRKVALKLLRPGSGGSRARERFLREAQALAKLSHPNVVAIHDVGTRAGQVWLTMELVQGQTLRTWLETPRSWPEVVRVMHSAGEGLAAAHAAELLHRDFKPDNVMLGNDGRVRVMDFGLALVRRTSTLDERLDASIEEVPVAKATSLAGTPAYMAPEQFVSTELDAAADQYSFCVTLWEALYGKRPLRNDAARRRETPKHRRVPSWLRRCCDRGLAEEPKQRWPSMAALLDALARGHTRARLRTGLVAVGVLAALGAGAEGLRRLDVARQVAACEASGNEIETVWNEDRRQALQAALVATGASYATVTSEKTNQWLDRQAAAWSEARVEACHDARVRGQWSEETLDHALWCLDERHTELGSLVDELTKADLEIMPKAVQAAAGLASVAPCRDERALEALLPPPAESREAVREVRALVTRAGNLELAGRYSQGLELAQQALVQAQALEWRPLMAAARLRLGSLLRTTGSYTEAETTLQDAYFEGDGGVASEVVFDAATELAGTVGADLARHGEGHLWVRHAESALLRIHDVDGLRRARLRSALAHVQFSAGAYDEAEATLEQVLAVRRDALGPEHPRVAATIKQLVDVYIVLGKHDEAKALLEESLAIYSGTLGPDHPELWGTLNSLANVHQATGAYAEAIALLEQLVVLAERALGPKHASLATSLHNLANVHYLTGNSAEAMRLYERALAIREEVLGAEHPHVAKTLTNLAIMHHTGGDYPKAKAMLERVVAIETKTLGTEHVELASTLNNLAIVHYMTGSYDEAKALYERALAIREKVLGPDHAHVAGTLVNLADVDVELRAYDVAERRYEQALAIMEKALGRDHADVGSILRRLADVQLEQNDLDEAEQLFQRSLTIYEHALGPDHPYVGNSLAGLARVALAHGRPADAIPLAERAVRVQEKSGYAPDNLATTQFVLAKALWQATAQAGGDRARAVALAEQCRDAYRKGGQGWAVELAKVEEWLAERTP